MPVLSISFRGDPSRNLYWLIPITGIARLTGFVDWKGLLDLSKHCLSLLCFDDLLLAGLS